MLSLLLCHRNNTNRSSSIILQRFASSLPLEVSASYSLTYFFVLFCCLSSGNLTHYIICAAILTVEYPLSLSPLPSTTSANTTAQLIHPELITHPPWTGRLSMLPQFRRLLGWIPPSSLDGSKPYLMYRQVQAPSDVQQRRRNTVVSSGCCGATKANPACGGHPPILSLLPLFPTLLPLPNSHQPCIWFNNLKKKIARKL